MQCVPTALKNYRLESAETNEEIYQRDILPHNSIQREAPELKHLFTDVDKSSVTSWKILSKLGQSWHWGNEFQEILFKSRHCGIEMPTQQEKKISAFSANGKLISETVFHLRFLQVKEQKEKALCLWGFRLRSLKKARYFCNRSPPSHSGITTNVFCSTGFAETEESRSSKKNFLSFSRKNLDFWGQK